MATTGVPIDQEAGSGDTGGRASLRGGDGLNGNGGNVELDAGPSRRGGTGGTCTVGASARQTTIGGAAIEIGSASVAPTFPGGMVLGASTDPQMYRGSGSPEGVVTAVVGSVYQNRTGGEATTLYVKETGSGNTGWVAVGGSSAVEPVVYDTIDEIALLQVTLNQALADGAEYIAYNRGDFGIEFTVFSGDVINAGDLAAAGTVLVTLNKNSAIRLKPFAGKWIATSVVGSWTLSSGVGTLTDPASYWPMDGSLANSGDTSTGVLTAVGSLSYVTGRVGSGIAFTGSDGQYLTAVNHASITPVAGWTIACWFRLTSMAAQCTVFSKGGFYPQINTTGSVQLFMNGAGSLITTTTGVITTNTWYHLVVTVAANVLGTV